MLLKYFYDKKLAQASYMVGCAATGEALVVDPARDIQQYIDAAEEEGLKITHITETHIHADYVSGSRELSAATGAMKYLSDMGDESWKYGYVDDNTILVVDGDSWMVGNIKVEVIHTPGHTPEHISFMITDTAGADKPIGVFTGDFLFVGDIGRPDLLEAAAGMIGTANTGAHQQFHTVKRFKNMPDYLQIWPAHGAGSACGKALGAIPSTTLGYEKLFNPAFQFEDEEEFVAWLLDGQPEAPKYFAQMKHVNKVGPELLNGVSTPAQLDRAKLEELLAQDALIIDMRPRSEYAAGYIPGTINIPENEGGCVSYVGWFVEYDQPTYIISHPEKAEMIINNFRAIGVDNIAGYFTPDVITGDIVELPLIASDALSNKVKEEDVVIIDVRGKTEFDEQHIAGARNIPLGYLPKHLDEIPKDSPVVMHCASGHRSQIAASLLRRYGYQNVLNLNEDKAIWEKALPLEHS